MESHQVVDEGDGLQLWGVATGDQFEPHVGHLYPEVLSSVLGKYWNIIVTGKIANFGP
jgi:hypothetical protein